MWAWAAGGWLGGLAWLQVQSDLPSLRACMAPALAGLPLLALAAWMRAMGGASGAWVQGLGLLLCAAALSLFSTAWRAQARLDERLPAAWEGRDLLLEGRIASLPQHAEGYGGAPGWRFQFEVERYSDPHSGVSRLRVPARVMLSGFAQPGLDAPDWRACERWRFTVRLKRPNTLMNPYGFDYELWLLEQGVGATGTVRLPAMARLAPASLLCMAHWREVMRSGIERTLAPGSAAGLTVALSLGDQAAIPAGDWQVFRDAGVSHLVAISGMHVTMFAWLMVAVAGRAWRLSPRACLWMPAPQAARWLGVGTAALYAWFSGGGVPSQRTIWMLACLALLRQLGVQWPWPLCLLAAAWLVCLVDPWTVLQPGFWLSFGAVALLMLQGEERPAAPPPEPGAMPGDLAALAAISGPGWRQRLLHACRSGMHIQGIATVGLAPLTLFFFQQISLMSWVANVLAIPWVTFVITPLALLGAIWSGFWVASAHAADLLMAWLHVLLQWPAAVWYVPVAPPWAQALGFSGAVLAVAPQPWRLRLCGVALMVPLLWPAPQRPDPGQFDLLAPDIGQGTAVLVRTQHHDLLYDTGPQWGPEADAGERVLVPLLRALGEHRLDALVLSHQDMDHVGGARSVAAALAPGRLFSSLGTGHKLLPKGLRNQDCIGGLAWDWDGVHFEFLHPQPGDIGRVQKPNALSCVLRVGTAAGHSVLLAGDLEAPQEQ
ncbi:MAG: DNA internalization-related competence protein ComEC/Rec2, partial [Burkholderiaceae bacterium]|nr:DNA internalization-related competence protein ComEC/Rec2 [Burkholderiaceae bacterium]